MLDLITFSSIIIIVFKLDLKQVIIIIESVACTSEDLNAKVQCENEKLFSSTGAVLKVSCSSNYNENETICSSMHVTEIRVKFQHACRKLEIRRR